ncbi:uncharacterized protein VP01_113g1 [Puccinia sorghi]|uniref:Peptidase S8/S53 domain-containing protein n=1 Tax=Puccinia sorghi TaxID=27349 RepID=A0A0L6VTD5_9BASI|nr:uncharacterized protein VP01_113g1 [Puccinia sorghi]
MAATLPMPTFPQAYTQSGFHPRHQKSPCPSSPAACEIVPSSLAVLLVLILQPTNAKTILIGVGFGLSFVPNNGPHNCSMSNRSFNRHGTHTAGIVATADVGYVFQGVSPKVTLGTYSFGCTPA